MTNVSWEDLDSSRYEQMVAVLISNLYPEALRIDGAGGDGGRDLLIREDGGDTVYELKSFTGRLTKGRRRQVEQSLKRAAQSQPDEWILVVPIDPTPGELEWFDQLKPDYSFPLTFRGRTWLDTQMAERPWVARYFSSAHEEAFCLLKELREEEATIQTAEDAVGRARKLHERLNEIDPFFTYDFAVGATAAGPGPPDAVLSVRINEDARVDVVERYRGALRDRPITGEVRIRIDGDDEPLHDRVDEAFGFGAPLTLSGAALEDVEIDAPGGLGRGAEPGGSLRLGGTRRVLEEPRTLRAEILGEDRLAAAMSFSLDEIQSGNRGAILHGRDSTGCIVLELRLDSTSKKLKLDLRVDVPTQEPLLPSRILAAGRWGRKVRPPHRLRLMMEGQEMGQPIPIEHPLLAEDGFQVVEALDDLQQASLVYFPMPLDLTESEAAEILRAARLLRGERVTFGWTEWVLPLENDGLKLSRLDPEEGRFRTTGDLSLMVREHRIPLGRGVTQVTGRVTNLEQVEAAVRQGKPVNLELQPGTDPTAVQWLIEDTGDGAPSS